MNIVYQMAPYKTSLIVISLLFLLLLIGGLLITGIVVYKFHKRLLIFWPTVGFSVITILLLLYFMQGIPKKIVLEKDNIVLNGLIKKIKIPYKQIEDVKRAKDTDFEGLSRNFGVADFWGYYGRYSSNQYPNIEMFCTDFDSVIIINTSQKSYWISPIHTEKFLKDLKEKWKP